MHDVDVHIESLIHIYINTDVRTGSIDASVHSNF